MELDPKTKTDVLIVGGGPAGLTLAKYLAESNVDFMLLEEDKTFGVKACGEAVIPSLGNYKFKELYGSNRGIERLTDSFIIRTKYGDIRESLQDFVIDKKTVEEHLAKQASKSGNRILMGQKVLDIKNTPNGSIIYPQNIHARILIGADGVNSRVRQAMNLPRPKCGVATSGILEMEPKNDLIVIFNKRLAPHGYAWMFPKADCWNIGIGNSHTKYFKKSFDNFKDMFPSVKNWNTSLIPVSKPLRSYSNNSLLVGDSASQIISFLGEGNLPAMICAKIASEVIIKASNNNFKRVDLSEYEKAWKSELGDLFLTSYLLSSIFYRLSFLPDYLIHKLLILISKTHLDIE